MEPVRQCHCAIQTMAVRAGEAGGVAKFFAAEGIKRRAAHTRKNSFRIGRRMDPQEAQFRGWIDRYHTALYRHAYWMTSRSEVAADVVQETYYEAWKARRNLKDEAKVLPWLLAILRRVVYREYAAQALHAADPSVQIEEAAAGGEHHLDDMVDLLRGLQRLDARQRELLLLYALHDFSYEQIGELLDIPLGTVMSRLARARRALAETMGNTTRGATIIPWPRLRRGNDEPT